MSPFVVTFFFFICWLPASSHQSFSLELVDFGNNTQNILSVPASVSFVEQSLFFGVSFFSFTILCIKKNFDNVRHLTQLKDHI